MHPALTKKKQKKSYFFHRDTQGKLREGPPDAEGMERLRRAALKRARKNAVRRTVYSGVVHTCSPLYPKETEKTGKKEKKSTRPVTL